MKLHQTIFNRIDNLGEHCYLTSKKLAIPHNLSHKMPVKPIVGVSFAPEPSLLAMTSIVLRALIQ